MDNWVHACPVLSHHGVVLPFEVPEAAEEPEAEEAEEEPEEAENDAENEPEAIEEANKAEEQEEEQEEEEKPIDIGPLAKQRLATAYLEADQRRILEENAAAVRDVARQKIKFTAPAAHWQIVRDTWEPELKLN